MEFVDISQKGHIVNYNELKELLDLLQNYGANIDKIEANNYCADVYFESENKEKYDYFSNLFNCDMHNSNDSYIRFYFSCNKQED